MMMNTAQNMNGHVIHRTLLKELCKRRPPLPTSLPPGRMKAGRQPRTTAHAPLAPDASSACARGSSGPCTQVSHRRLPHA